MNPKTTDVPASNDAGIGLIEIVVAMFILAIIALSFLPVIAQGLRSSATNSSVSTATQLLSSQLELARKAGSTCDAAKSFADADPAPVVVGGRTYTIDRALVGPCPDTAAATKGTVLIDISVSGGSPATELATAQTRVYVGGS